MPKIQVVIAEDSEEICAYLGNLIKNEQDMELAGTAFSGAEAVKIAAQLKPDIVLMDIQMETKTAGIDAIGKIRESNPEIKVIVLTIHSRDDLLYRAYAAGAMDYIIKTSPASDVINSIRAVSSNKLLLRPDIANKIIGECIRVQETQSKMQEVLMVMMKITNTEFEIIKLIYDGYSYQEIAKQRFVEETTIRSEIYWILKKFNRKRMKEVISLLKEIRFFETFNLD
ncbi:DNA-binding response regulator [Spirochaetia bacterium]|nr:DNA-binding response regulator [Spirochaetia bacterium]